jgi:hypothetical protein
MGAVWLGGCRSDITPGRFEKADLDDNGLITRAEAGVFVASSLFDGLDKDHDRKIVSAEWNAGGNSMTVQSFRKADQNHDNAISEEELKLAAIQSKQMGEFMSEADKDRDGGVTKQEALAYYASKEGPVQ